MPELGNVEQVVTEAEPENTRKPRSAYLVTCYAFAVAITPEFTFLGIPKVRLTDLLLPLLYLSYVGSIGSSRGSRNKSVFQGLCVSLLAWDLGALFLWGQAKITPGIFYLAKRGIYFLVALFCSACVNNKRAWNQVVRMLVFASPILNCSVLLEMRVNQAAGGAWGSSEGMRASGIIAQQETSTALFIVIVTCLSLGAWDAYKDLFWKLGTSLTLLTGCCAIFATGSRGGLACAVLSVVILVGVRPQRALAVGLLGILVGVVAWNFTPDVLRSRLAGIFPETQATLNALANGREYMPDAGGSSIAGRALTAENFFSVIMPQAGLMGMGAGWKNLGSIDNFYLTEWMYHGLIGLGLFLQLQYALVVFCLKSARDAKDPVEKGVASGVATAVLVMSASGVHGDTFYLIRPMECLALLVGLVVARRSIRS